MSAWDALAWEDIRPTATRRAVRVTTENAHQIAEFFGGEVEVIRGTTRLNFAESGTSAPAHGWMCSNGEWLWDEDAWESTEEPR